MQALQASTPNTVARTLALDGLQLCALQFSEDKRGGATEDDFKPSFRLLEAIWRKSSEASVDKALAAYIQGVVYKVSSNGELSFQHGKLLARAALISSQATQEEKQAQRRLWHRDQTRGSACDVTGESSLATAGEVFAYIKQWAGRRDTASAESLAASKNTMVQAYRARGLSESAATERVEQIVQKATSNGGSNLHWPGAACDSCGVKASDKKLSKCARCMNSWCGLPTFFI